MYKKREYLKNKLDQEFSTFELCLLTVISNHNNLFNIHYYLILCIYTYFNQKKFVNIYFLITLNVSNIKQFHKYNKVSNSLDYTRL